MSSLTGSLPVTALPVMARRPLWGWGLHDAIVVTKRHLIQTLRIPEMLFFSLVQPVIFVVLFAYVFGGAIAVTGGAYKSFLIPGIMVQTVAFAAASSTVGLAEDLHKGIIDRFRSLPMAASAVLFGRTLADAVRNVLVLTILTLTGLAIGWRIDNGWLAAIGAYLLLLFFSYAMAWIGAWVGLYMPNPETANTAGLIWLFPVTFISNAFVPLAGMPHWLQTVAEWNPVSAVALAARQLFGNPTGQAGNAWPMLHPLAWSLISCLALLAIFVPLAVRRYRRTTTH